MKDRKDWIWRGADPVCGGLGGVERAEAMVRIYFMRKESLLNKKKNEKNGIRKIQNHSKSKRANGLH